MEVSKDPLWGCGLHIKDPDLNNRGKWCGENLLGRILVRVRSKLTMEDTSSRCPARTISQSSDDRYSYASVLSTAGPWIMKKQQRQRQQLSVSQQGIRRMRGTGGQDGLLKGVPTPIPNSTTDYYVGQLHPSTQASNLKAFLHSKGVNIRACFPLKTKLEDTTAFRIRCNKADTAKILNESLWPDYVVIREWIKKD